MWWRAGHNPTRTAAIQRDHAVLAARLDAAALYTLDYRNPADAQRRWLALSTGTLHDEVAQTMTSTASLIKQAKVSTSAVVLDAAASELDTAHGTASVLISMNTTKRPAAGAASTARNRYLATMKRVGRNWKITDLQLVPVALS